MFRKSEAVPEYILDLANRARRTRVANRQLLGIPEVQEKKAAIQAATMKKTETPPNVIPFPANYLSLNLAPPHGMPPPPVRHVNRGQTKMKSAFLNFRVAL